MKKYQRLFLALLALVMQVSIASAKDYTDQLEVKIGDNPSSKQEATVTLNKDNAGKYTFSLKNFILTSNDPDFGEQQIGVGTIEITDVKASTNNGITTLVAEQTIKIKDGDIASPSESWMGPILPEVPIKLIAQQKNDKLFAVINIDMSKTLQMKIKVTFGNGHFQIPNSDFEQFTPSLTEQKDLNKQRDFDYWHSFSTATGIWAKTANSYPHVFVSNDVAPDSKGKHSLLLKSTETRMLFFGTIKANGTLTTGRLNAGSTTAADTQNHASMVIPDNPDEDNNLDPQHHPFYTLLYGRPSAVSVWVKFKQGTPQPVYKYATISATITDGTSYQEPEDKTYNNVIAKAKNDKIESNGFTWQHLTIPFNYINNHLEGKGILLTMSTNATPGQGSVDELYVDDLTLIYDQDITVNSISVKGQQLTLGDNMTYTGAKNDIINDKDIVLDTKAPFVFKSFEHVDGGVNAYVTVASGDFNSFKTYKITMSNVTTGISGVHSAQHSQKAIYNLQGQHVEQMIPGNVYIIKQNGKTTKVYKK